MSTHEDAPRTGRLAWPTPGELDGPARRLYDAIVGGPRAATRAFPMTDEAGRLYGPFNAMLLEPVVGNAVQELGAAIRYRGVVSDRLRELAILEVAATLRSEFEWFAHGAIATSIGFADADLDAIRRGETAPGLDADEALWRRLAHLLVTERDLDDTAYGQAVASFGEAALADLVFLVGFYALIASLLATFRVPLPPGEPGRF